MKALSSIALLLVLGLGLCTWLFDFDVSTHPPNQILLEINTDPGALRPRSYCIGNPLRNRQPESTATHYLEELREGNIEPILAFVSSDEMEHISLRERQYPIRSWRLGGRRDDICQISIMYWVKRGNDYPGEEEVRFWFQREGDEWVLTQFGAIY